MHKFRNLTIIFILLSSLSSSLVLADQVVERKNYPKGHVTVDGIKIDGTERDITMADGSSAVVLQYQIRAYPGDEAKYGDKNGKYRFFKNAAEKGYVTNTLTFIAISNSKLQYDLSSGKSAIVRNAKGKPLEINFKKTWKEFDGQEGIYAVEMDHLKNLPYAKPYFDEEIGWWAVNSGLPVEKNGELVASGDRALSAQSLKDIWGVNGYAPQAPTRDVLTEFSSENPPKDGIYQNYKYFKKIGDGLATSNVDVFKAGQKLNKTEADAIKVKKDVELVNARVEIDSFDPDNKDKLLQDYFSKKAEKKNDGKKDEGKNWWDKLLSWLVYDEDFVTQQVEEMKGLLSAGIGDGFSISEGRDERTVLYDYALEQGQWTNGYGTISIYGGIDVLRNLGTGFTSINDWYTISKGFTKWLFVLASNAYIIKKLYKRFDGNG